MIETVAKALGPFVNEVAFVGGATASFYVDLASAVELRPTDDVDCVIDVVSKSEYFELEQRLREMGFVNDRSLICRWQISGVKFDLMPTNSEILGFENKWYQAGLDNKVEQILPSENKIFIFTLPYFLASKLEALNSRGGDDWRVAHDLEDILLVIDGSVNLVEEITSSKAEVKKYLSTQATELLSLRNINDLLNAHLSHEGASRIERAKKLLEDMAGLD